MFAVARAHYGHAAEMYREQGDVLAYAHTIRHVADIWMQEGKTRQEGNAVDAKPLYEEALEIYRSNLDTKLLDLANTVRPCALVQEALGNTDFAMALWEEARNLYGSLRIEAGVEECGARLSKLRLSA
jgi:tetratricopeptide (TPR) repeat protein